MPGGQHDGRGGPAAAGLSSGHGSPDRLPSGPPPGRRFAPRPNSRPSRPNSRRPGPNSRWPRPNARGSTRGSTTCLPNGLRRPSCYPTSDLQVPLPVTPPSWTPGSLPSSTPVEQPGQRCGRPGRHAAFSTDRCIRFPGPLVRSCSCGMNGRL